MEKQQIVVVKIAFFDDYRFGFQNEPTASYYFYDAIPKLASRSLKALLKQIQNQTNDAPPLHSIECEISPQLEAEIKGSASKRVAFDHFDKVLSVPFKVIEAVKKPKVHNEKRIETPFELPF